MDKRQTKMVKTPDDWYPTYEGGLVRVSFMQLLDGKTWRVCAWGNDDFGLERDFDTREGALLMYESVPENVSHNWFYNREFTHA